MAKESSPTTFPNINKLPNTRMAYSAVSRRFKCFPTAETNTDAGIVIFS
eukprot:CAMPEP_0201649022 /NCGR_PEP_ID=MMETSP0493-20130528/38648_1 /ASSEMBLY_ACC=CAM_ASM_000838 /TAXON_ID=420259 /ORGANISM="Thalassiosira gravida, Strain GMp14c1" /LENGTH=48 /DNA_ID= /DNA_START= /DNA_END= /DNA_ORIENTATION=